MIESMTRARARDLWIHAQALTARAPFGEGPEATRRAVEHLGYVQIDTINVIERCHHHILFNRIPSYRRSHLTFAQAEEKSVFEYWTHALSYIPTRDFRFFIRAMRDRRREPGRWFGTVQPAEIRKVLRTIETDGPMTIRDVEGEELVEKTHPWASKKPSKKALELAFYGGQVVIAERVGMLKKYELTLRHLGWSEWPKPATEKEILEYRIDRALRAQAFVSLDSVAYLIPSLKPLVRKAIERRVRDGKLVELKIEGLEKTDFWIAPDDLRADVPRNELTHILSPFDPLVIQRKRLAHFFDYEHRFEAYLPKGKRVYGYFALPVLVGDRIVALIDLKTDRAGQALLIQKWTWRPKMKSKDMKARIESELHRFEAFQLGR